MYTKEQLSGILLVTAIPKLKTKKANTKVGWTVRHSIEIRAPLRMIDGIERSLGSLFNIEPKRIPEPARHRDMLIVSRQADVVSICNIMPDGAPAKSNSWSRMKRGMKIVEEGRHTTMKKKDFEVILIDETKDIYRQTWNREDV